MKIDRPVFEKSTEQKREEKKIIGKKKPNKNNKVFRWKRKTLINILNLNFCSFENRNVLS